MSRLFKFILRKISWIYLLNRIQKSLIIMAVDSAMAFLIIFFAFSLRLGYWYFPEKSFVHVFEYWVIYCSPVILLPVFYSFGLYRSVTQFIGVRGFSRIAQATALYSALWGLFVYMANIQGIPRSVILINWMLGTIIFIGIRIFARWLLYENGLNSNEKKNIIIYGANSSGIQLSQSLQLSESYKHVAYVDHDESLIGDFVNGVEVFSPNKIKKIINNQGVSDIFLAMPDITRYERKLIIDSLSSFSVQVKSLPSLNHLVEGKVKVDDLREININDLLGRELVKPNNSLMKKNIDNKVVFVSGAGGSIGSELCSQILNFKPSLLILFDLSETALYSIEQKLLKINSHNIKIIPIIGSVRDKERLNILFKSYSVQTIYHAAAYKHVPLVEHNQAEGIINNAIGTLVLAEMAMLNKVETFVLISTDKAVRPTNVMGASKRIAELILQALSMEDCKTCFTMVRFGNVLESSGSVIPLFKKQIKEGGPVTVTDQKIKRYFMTIPEAVELVIQAGSMAKGGDVFVLDMGEPVKIFDLATKMIKLSGLQVKDESNPNGDIEVKFTGLRPGEKLFEELLIGGNVSKTKNKLIMRAQEEMIQWPLLDPLLRQLEIECKNNNHQKIHQIISELVPEFKPQSNNLGSLIK